MSNHDIWRDPPAEHYDNGVRFGTASEMIAEIKSLRAEKERLNTLITRLRGEVAQALIDVDSDDEQKICAAELTLVMVADSKFEPTENGTWIESERP